MKISILIAARNEANNILELLNSLEGLHYPKSSLEILIANDGSEDKTTAIISDFITEKPHYKLININYCLENLKGKANALAQLAHLAKGEYFFFTDADIVLPPNWINAMLAAFNNPTIGVVTGTTCINYNNSFEACQSIEWLSALYLMKLMEQYKIPVTGMGNNMAVSAAAYWAVGGYETIGFSIVEDYALFKAIIAQGYGFRQLFDRNILAKTKAPKGIIAYFEQRKRWMVGGFESKSVLIFLAILQAIFLPILLIISTLSINTALIVGLLKFTFDIVFGINLLKKIGERDLKKYLIIYELYMLIFPACQLLYYLSPGKIRWKGRAY